jgi:hypothetical protein
LIGDVPVLAIVGTVLIVLAQKSGGTAGAARLGINFEVQHGLGS